MVGSFVRQCLGGKCNLHPPHPTQHCQQAPVPEALPENRYGQMAAHPPPLVDRRSLAGQLALLYTLIQGLFDLSLLHWPVTVVLTGVLLGIPLSWHRSSASEAPQI